MDTFRAKERIAAVAGRQHGRIHRRQLVELGVPSFTIAHWVGQGYLTRLLPRVYAVGHTAPSREADLWTAVLYAGPGAMLSHQTAGHRLGIVDHPPPQIEVSTPRRIRSTPRIRVYGQRQIPRELSAGLPVTTIPQTLLDIAATAPPRTLRRALAQLDYRHQLGPERLRQLDGICGHGRRGSVSLRRALAVHDPRYGRTNGTLEEAFLEQLQRHRLPLPKINHWIGGIQVDAYWPEHGLVVELDSGANHTSVAQLRRDRANELELRGLGLQVIRYGWEQVHDRARPVIHELADRLLSRRSPTSSGQAGRSPDRRFGA